MVAVTGQIDAGFCLIAAGFSARTTASVALVEELFPICRSVIGNRARRGLEILPRFIPLEVNEHVEG